MFVTRVLGEVAPCQELLRQEIAVCSEWHDLALRVQVLLAGHQEIASCRSQCLVLEGLQVVPMGVADCWHPDRCSVF